MIIGVLIHFTAVINKRRSQTKVAVAAIVEEAMKYIG
jgi:hypothetical protein